MFFLGPGILTLLLLQAAPPEERARVEYVLVDVVARDRQHRLVTDLTLDDFVVIDGGRKVPLESLDILDLRRQVVVAGGKPIVSDSPFLPPPARARRSQVLLVLDVLPGGTGPARQAVRWVDRYLEGTESLRGIEYRLHSVNAGTLMEKFSEDPNVVRQALTAFRREQVDRGRQVMAGEADAPHDLFLLEKHFQDCQLNGLPLAIWNCVQDELQAFVEQENAHTDALLRELVDLADGFPEPDSLKTMVLISTGFSTRPGRAARDLARLYLPRTPPLPPAQSAVPLPGSPPEEPGAPQESAAPEPRLADFGGQYLRLLDACARNRVTFDAVDLFQFGIEEQRVVDAQLGRGRGAVPVYHAQRLEMQGGPQEVCRQTGGTFVLDPAGLRPLLEGDRFVYVLGYRSPAREPGRFRKIEVRCRRGAVTLVHRAGYVS